LARQRKLFLQQLIGFEFQYWRKTARERYEQGIGCCACCAKIFEDREEAGLDESLCYDCREEMEDPRYPEWFGDGIRISLKLRVTPQNPEERITPDEETSLEYNITTPPQSPCGWPSEDHDDSSGREGSTISGSKVSRSSLNQKIVSRDA
jgi:hypothetical protein